MYCPLPLSIYALACPPALFNVAFESPLQPLFIGGCGEKRAIEERPDLRFYQKQDTLD
jgi:hypothetical protein